MNARAMRWWMLAMGGGALLAECNAAVDGRYLLRRSPFEPVASNVATQGVTSLPLEYVGFIHTREGVKYRVRDPVRKVAAFVRLHERDGELGVVATGYDSVAQALTVEHAGRTLTLPEPRPKVRPSAPIAPLPSPGVASPRASAYPVPRAVTDAVVLNPSAQQEGTRLQVIADEIRRRREERDKAAAATK